MATKAPAQKSSNQIPQQKEQNPNQKSTTQIAQPPAKDVKDNKDDKSKKEVKDNKDTQNNAPKDKNPPPPPVQNQPNNQGSKTNLAVQQNDPNQKKSSSVAVPPQNGSQQNIADQGKRPSVQNQPVQGVSNPIQNTQNSIPNSQAVSKNNLSSAMGNFFDAFDANPQSVPEPAEVTIDENDLKDDDDDNLKPIPTDDPKELERRKNQAEMFKKYLDNTGVSMAFQIIYAEILAKKINQDNVFGYTAMRLRQIGNDLAAISNKVKK